jgi:outer membrane lipoprotein SlyB
MCEVLVMSEQITIDELLKLVRVEKIGGKWNLRAIIGDVSDDCCGSIGGDVWGNIGGSVEGDIEGDVIGDVFGNVVGNVHRCSRPE